MNPIQTYLIKAAKPFKTFQCMIKSAELNLEVSHSSTHVNQAFHSASVGKLFTAVLIFKALEEGRCTLESKIDSMLEAKLLDKLFIFQGVDYRTEVTLKHLLSHTSGVNDYFESKTIDGSSFIDEVLKQPHHFYTPQELIHFTQTKQKAIAAPGQKFHYSDTGYILLGLICESLYNTPLNTLIQEMIAIPCGLCDTYLCFYDDRFNAQDLAPLWMNKVEVSQFTSLSCDFSGGGLHTTASDLTKFLHALIDETLISKTSLDRMTRFDHKFRNGLYYGLGCMMMQPKDFFFLLKGLPPMIGHLGVTGIHAWIEPQSKTSIVMNVGNNKDMGKSFQVLITILQMMKSLEKKSQKNPS